MGLILNLETATKTCSVAIALNGKLLSLRESHRENSHSELITTYIEEALKTSGYELPQIDAIAVSHGPGSYTGLRIGVSTAKGIAYSLKKPIIQVSTLAALKETALKQVSESGFMCPMIDARRDEVFMSIYNQENKLVKEESPQIISMGCLDNFLSDEYKAYIFGNGAAKCINLLDNTRFQEIDNIECSALGMLELAEKKFQKSEFTNIVSFVPNYLKKVHIK